MAYFDDMKSSSDAYWDSNLYIATNGIKIKYCNKNVILCDKNKNNFIFAQSTAYYLWAQFFL